MTSLILVKQTIYAPDVGSHPPFCRLNTPRLPVPSPNISDMWWFTFTTPSALLFHLNSHHIPFMFQLKYHFSCFNHHPQSISILAIESRAIRGYITVSDTRASFRAWNINKHLGLSREMATPPAAPRREPLNMSGRLSHDSTIQI